MTNPQKVLVVDDQTDNLVLLEMILEDDFDVTCRISGEECLAEVDDICPNIIILDVNMPTIDGFEVCRRLKSQPNTADIPIIFLTALDLIEQEKIGYEIGAADYITKPVDAERLISSINKALASN